MDVEKFIMDMPDEVVSRFQFSAPWQYSSGTSDTDEDGFPLTSSVSKEDAPYSISKLQQESWKKFNRNPQVNTAIRGIVGRLTGMGFECISENPKVQEVIEEITDDPRNRLYNFWPKYVGRLHIEGELFLSLTVHVNGFVEVDFVDPGALSPNGDDGTGVIWHPRKSYMPLFYDIEQKDGGFEQIPSIFIARYPELLSEAAKNHNFDINKHKNSKGYKPCYKKIGGYNRFIISLDKGFMTRRAASYLQTVLAWLNHYENLKKWEIDHKKSSGSYAWVFTFEDIRAFKQWIALSDEDKKKTAIMSPMTPGGRMILPPGVKCEPKNPNLTKISDQDSDILQMIVSGLNESEDTLMGSLNSTFASSKAQKGPASDRISDEIEYFKRFLIYDFWGSIFFLRSKVAKFPDSFKMRECVGFRDKEPIFKNVKRKPEQLIDVSFPVSENIDTESRSRALLGVKHSNINATLGIPYEEMAKRMGFAGYGRMRKKAATEAENYPKLIIETDSLVDEDSKQEINNEKGKKVEKTVPKVKDKTDSTVGNK